MNAAELRNIFDLASKSYFESHKPDMDFDDHSTDAGLLAVQSAVRYEALNEAADAVGGLLASSEFLRSRAGGRVFVTDKTNRNRCIGWMFGVVGSVLIWSGIIMFAIWTLRRAGVL